MYTVPAEYLSLRLRMGKNGICYHARQIPNDAPGASDSRSPRLQKIDWDKDGMPVLGTPQKEEEPMARPSGSPIHKKQN